MARQGWWSENDTLIRYIFSAGLRVNGKFCYLHAARLISLHADTFAIDPAGAQQGLIRLKLTIVCRRLMSHAVLV